ncbi:MAG: Acyl-CoA thioesterase [Ilumatobacteraceae bacterium]|nr:Acyl-CoA thioesterase [Ilumatobacteraceae bacterium]
MDAHELFRLADHGPDTFVGQGPQYPWGGLYGGQIVAQALRAAAATVEGDLFVHSLRAYFIRRGDHAEPVRFEVDRIRNGRSFCTRRVVARQATGAILNLEASFQAPEPSADVQTVDAPVGVPAPLDVVNDSWTTLFERRTLPARALTADGRTGTGRYGAWMRAAGPLGDDPLLHACMLAYMSDDLPTDAVVRAHPIGSEPDLDKDNTLFVASLDHTIWFHRPGRADDWHLHDFSCHNFVGSRGLSVGHVFAIDGTHIATIAQEVLVRDRRLHG